MDFHKFWKLKLERQWELLSLVIIFGKRFYLTVSTKLSRLKKLEVMEVVNLQILRMYIRIYNCIIAETLPTMQEVQQENVLAASLQPLETHLLPL